MNRFPIRRFLTKFVIIALLLLSTNNFVFAQKKPVFTNADTLINQIWIYTNFNKTVIKEKDHSFYLSVPFPFRFGNNALATVGSGLQVGIAF